MKVRPFAICVAHWPEVIATEFNEATHRITRNILLRTYLMINLFTKIRPLIEEILFQRYQRTDEEFNLLMTEISGFRELKV